MLSRIACAFLASTALSVDVDIAPVIANDDDTPTDEEIIAKFACITNSAADPSDTLAVSALGDFNTDDLPSTFDWTKNTTYPNIIPAVNDDDGECAACWAYATADTVSAAYMLYKNTTTFTEVSSQQLIDCATGTRYEADGCSGGRTNSGFEYLIANNITTAADYPFTGTDDSACMTDVGAVNTLDFKLSGY